MIQSGRDSLKKVAVVGRGTAGSLAAAAVSKELSHEADHELHHIYDSRIPIIGVGEGSWPSLVQQLHEYSGLPHDSVQERLNATRKYGVTFEDWGRANKNFTHFFTPQLTSYAYHLSADLVADMLQESTQATHVDANVVSISTKDDGALVEFDGREPELYDLVFDARGFPKEIDPAEHIEISFIPTNQAVIRRCPTVIDKPSSGPVTQQTNTRAIARPYGWVFVIPLTVHTSYGYIFNADLTSLEDVEADFDELLKNDGVEEFEQRAVLSFPNFVHREIYDGRVARIGNAGAFMEPLEATAIAFAQMEIGMVLHMRLNRSVARLAQDAPIVNRFLVNYVLCNGLFVGWHYSCGSNYDTEFWRYARDTAWSQHPQTVDPKKVDCAALSDFHEMVDPLYQPDDQAIDWEKRKCGLPLTSYRQIFEGLGC